MSLFKRDNIKEGNSFRMWTVIIEREIREIEDFKKLLREEGYSEKAIKEILKWYE